MQSRYEAQAEQLPIHEKQTSAISCHVIEHLKNNNPELFVSASPSHDGFLNISASQLGRVESTSIHAQEIERFFNPSGLFEQIINNEASYQRANASLFISHQRVQSFECIAQRYEPHNGYKSVTIMYWPQTEKGYASGSYKKIKTNCYEIKFRIHDSGAIEGLQSRHFVALSKHSPIFLGLPQNRSFDAQYSSRLDKVNHVCSQADGWEQIKKLSKNTVVKDTVIAPWLGEPICEHLQLVKQHIIQLMEQIVLAANVSISSRKFPYDLKGVNVVVARVAGKLKFSQIDYATFAVTPARFPWSEANLDQLKYRANVYVWIRDLVQKMETNPWTVFVSNFIFLIFEMCHWNNNETANVLDYMMRHIELFPPRRFDGGIEVWPAEFCKFFKIKANSFILDARGRQTEWRKAVHNMSEPAHGSIQQPIHPTVTAPVIQTPATPLATITSAHISATSGQSRTFMPVLPPALAIPAQTHEQVGEQSTIIPTINIQHDSSLVLFDSQDSYEIIDENPIPVPIPVHPPAQMMSAWIPQRIKGLFGF